MKFTKVLTVSVSLTIGLATSIHAHAATIHIKNCADKAAKVCMWNASDTIGAAPVVEKKLGSKKHRKYSCTGSFCKLRVTGKKQGCRYRDSGKENMNGQYNAHGGKYITIHWVSKHDESLTWSDAAYDRCK